MNNYFNGLAVMLLVISGVSVAGPFPDDDDYESSSYESSSKVPQAVKVTGEMDLPEFKPLPPSMGPIDEVYRLGVGDLVSVEVFQVKDLNHSTHVNSAGNVTLPLIGAVHLEGLSTQDAEMIITEKLGEYLQDPHVTLVIKSYESQRVTVEGWVKKPGVFILKGALTLLQVIATGGGVAPMGDGSQVTIFRELESGERVAYVVDLDEIREGKLEDPRIYNKDMVVVPEHGTKAIWKGVSQFLRFTPYSVN